MTMPPKHLDSLHDLANWAKSEGGDWAIWGELIAPAADALDEFDRLDDINDVLVERSKKTGQTPDADTMRDTFTELDRVREILVAFGALLPDDHATGTADMVEALLPPAAGDS